MISHSASRVSHSQNGLEGHGAVALTRASTKELAAWFGALGKPPACSTSNRMLGPDDAPPPWQPSRAFSCSASHADTVARHAGQPSVYYAPKSNWPPPHTPISDRHCSLADICLTVSSSRSPAPLEPPRRNLPDDPDRGTAAR